MIEFMLASTAVLAPSVHVPVVEGAYCEFASVTTPLATDLTSHRFVAPENCVALGGL